MNPFRRPVCFLTFTVSVMIAFILPYSHSSFAQTQSNTRGDTAKVFRGEEVVVSFPTLGKGFSARATAKVTNLKLGVGTRLSKSLSQGQLGVFSSTATIGTRVAGPVQIKRSDIDTICASIRAANRGVELTCEANSIVDANIVPNDTQYAALYGMTRISAPSAWDISTGSTNVMVAVVDTGIDYNHPDLVDNIATNSKEIPNNGVDDDGNGYIDDYYGYDFSNNDSNPIDDHYHGTHCAGTVGAKGNNGRGVAGVAWTVKLLPVKVLNSSGSGTSASVAAGITYAVRRGAKVVSLSLGSSSYSSTIENAIITARNAGVLVVAAAGNDSQNTDVYPNYPSALTQDNILAVAASTSSDSFAYFSNYGATSVDLAAPGDSILSTYISGQYAYASGTSMATPHVAGMAALLLAVNPNLSYSSIRSILIGTVDPIPSMAGKLVSGGRANLYKAVLQAQSGQTPTPVATVTATPTFTRTPTATPTRTPTSSVTNTPTPTPTWTPTRVATSTPMPTATIAPTRTPTIQPTNTATPTPPAIEPPAEAEPDPNSISIGTERTRTRVYIFGDVTDSADVPQPYLTVKMKCGGRIAATRSTDDEGYYEFVFRRPSRPVRCYAEDSTGARSRRITVR